MSERLFACAVCGHQAVLDPWRDLGNGVATFDPPSCAAHPRPVAMREVAQDVHHHRPLGSDGGGDKQRATDSNGHSEINGENEAKEGW